MVLLVGSLRITVDVTCTGVLVVLLVGVKLSV